MDGIEFFFSQETPSTFIASLLNISKDMRVTVWTWLVFVNWTICKSHSDLTPVSTFASEMMPVDPESVNYLPSWTMHPSQNSTHPAAKRTYLFHILGCPNKNFFLWHILEDEQAILEFGRESVIAMNASIACFNVTGSAAFSWKRERIEDIPVGGVSQAQSFYLFLKNNCTKKFLHQINPLIVWLPYNIRCDLAFWCTYCSKDSH